MVVHTQAAVIMFQEIMEIIVFLELLLQMVVGKAEPITVHLMVMVARVVAVETYSQAARLHQIKVQMAETVLEPVAGRVAAVVAVLVRLVKMDNQPLSQVMVEQELLRP